MYAISTRIGATAVIGSALLGGVGSASAGQEHCAESKLMASDGAADDQFASCLSVSVDTVIVGAWNDDDAGANSGSAYVYVRSGDAWLQQAKLTAADADPDDKFGFSVAIDGDTAVVGAPRDDEAALNAGAAYVFVRSGDEWTQQAKLTAPDAAGWDFFGHSLAVSGETVIVGALDDDDMGADSGAAHVFVRSEETWTPEAKLTAADGAAGDEFGSSVAIFGDSAVVGAHADEDSGEDSGSAYVFVRNAGAWSPQAKLTASDGAQDDRFGAAGSLSISGDTAIVGAGAHDGTEQNSGAAYVFVRTGDEWAEQAKLTAFDESEWSFFGAGVSVFGDMAIVGAWGNEEIGAAYLVMREGETWTERWKFRASDADELDEFGCWVALSGDTAVIGAYKDDDAGLNAGAAYVYVAAAFCPADVDGDGLVSFADVLALLSRWGPCPGCPEDITCDEVVSFADILRVLATWGPCP